MAVNQLKVSRLTRLHARWMGLNEHFPLVAHCCATQEGPVDVLAKTKDGESVKMKSISSAVLSRLHWRRSDIDLLDVNFSGPAEALAFESSLHAGLWTSIAKLPLRQLDLMWSQQVVPYTEVQTIQILNDERTWYADCAFSREWDHLSGNQRSGKRYEWLDAVGPLAAESLEICRSMFRIDVPTIDEYCSPLNPWLSVVYSSYQPEIHPPRKFSDTCFECKGAKLDLGDRIVELQRPESATVMSSTTWLRVDIATASANVLERLLDDMQSGRETSTHRGSQLYGSGWGSVTGSTPPEAAAIPPDELLPEPLKSLFEAEIGSMAEFKQWAHEACEQVRQSNDRTTVRLIVERAKIHARLIRGNSELLREADSLTPASSPQLLLAFLDAVIDHVSGSEGKTGDTGKRSGSIDPSSPERTSLSSALDEQKAAKEKVAVGFREQVLIRHLKPADAPLSVQKWLLPAIYYTAEKGRKPGWAELSRAISGPEPQSIGQSRYFGSHPGFKAAMEEIATYDSPSNS